MMADLRLGPIVHCCTFCETPLEDGKCWNTECWAAGLIIPLPVTRHKQRLMRRSIEFDEYAIRNGAGNCVAIVREQRGVVTVTRPNPTRRTR